MADSDDLTDDGGLAQAVNEEVIVSLSAVAASAVSGTHSSTASQATIASTASTTSSVMNPTPPPPGECYLIVRSFTILIL